MPETLVGEMVPFVCLCFGGFHELRDCCTERIGTHEFVDKLYGLAEGLHGTHMERIPAL